MHERSLKLKDSEWFTPNFTGFLITTLKIRSLRKHFTDLTVDQTIMNSDFICITETHIQTNEESDLQLPNYNAFFQSEGKGKGCVIYTHHSLGQPCNLRSVGTNKYQIMILTFPDIQVVNVYRSQSSNQTLKDIFNYLYDYMDFTRPLLITGDFNLAFNQKPKNYLSRKLWYSNLCQIFQTPTCNTQRR